MAEAPATPLPSRKPFLEYIHGFRGVAILAVVATHLTGALHWSRASPLAERAVHALVRNGTVPFVFVAGFLFQYLSARFRYGAYLLNKLKYVIVPYVVVSIPILVHQWLGHTGAFADVPPGDPALALEATGRALLTGGHMLTPLWFVPAISLFYLTTPLFLAIDRKPALYWLIAAAIPLAMFIHRPLGHGLVWQSAVYCLPAYLVGSCASHYREPLLDWLHRHRVLVWASFFALILVELFVIKRSGPVFSQRPFSIERGVVDFDMPAKLIASLALLELLRARRKRLPAWLLAIAANSFGIFFVHEYVIIFLHAAAPRAHVAIEQGSVLMFLLLWPIAVLGSQLLVLLVQKLSGKYSRYLVGC